MFRFDSKLLRFYGQKFIFGNSHGNLGFPTKIHSHSHIPGNTVRFGKSPVNRKMVNYFHHFGESNLGTLLSGERGGVARESLLADTQHSPNSKLLNRAQSSIHLISKFKIKTVRKDILWHIIRGLPWEFGRNLDFNIFSRKLACIGKKTSPKRWDYFRTKKNTFSRSNLRKTRFF